MKKELLAEMLSELVSGDRTQGTREYEVPDRDEVTVLAAMDGALLNVEKVGRVRLREALVLLETTRSEVFVLDADCIMGLKLRRSTKESTGFLPT